MPSSASVECKQTRTRSSSKESPKVTASDSPVESDTRMASSNPEEKSATGSKRTACADVTSAPKAKKSKAVPTTRSRRVAVVSKSLAVTEKALRSRKKSREPEEESSESPEPEEEKQEEPASASVEAASMKDEQEKRGKEEQSHTESEPEERERTGQTSCSTTSTSEQLELDAQQKKPDEDENKEKKEEEEKQEDEEQKRILCALRSLSNDLICSEQEPPVPEEPLFENLFEPGKDCKDGVRSEFWKNVVTLTSPSRSPSADEANPQILPPPPPPPPQASTAAPSASTASTDAAPDSSSTGANLSPHHLETLSQQQENPHPHLHPHPHPHSHQNLQTEHTSTSSTASSTTSSNSPTAQQRVETSRSCEPASTDALDDVHVNACVKVEPPNQETSHLHSLSNDDSLSSHSMSYPESPSGCGPGGYRVIR